MRLYSLSQTVRDQHGGIVGEQAQGVLRLQLHMIPALRAEFDGAIAQLGTALVDLRTRGYLTTAWLGDETSAEVVAHYTHRAFEEPDSSYAALVGYLAELTRIRDTLQRMEDHYLGTDQVAADQYRRT